MGKKEKVYDLLATHEETNIELAWFLDASQNLGVRQHLKASFKGFMDYYSLSELFIVKQIVIKHGALIGVSPQVGLLTQLIGIYLEHNNITHIPTEICSLPNLRWLSFAYNQIQYIPKEIGGLPKLRELHIEHNRVNRLPKEIGELNHLKYLDIRSNPLADGEFSKIRKLLPDTDIW